MHNASQLRRFVINSLAFELFTTESYIFKSNIWSSYITLDKPKVTKGIVIRKTRQIPFIDQFIAETVLFQSSLASNSCEWRFRVSNNIMNLK